MAQDGNHRAEDIGQQQVAAVYAKALLLVGEESGQTAELLEQFESLVEDVLDKNPQFERTLTSALISHEDKAALLDRVLGKSAHPTLLNFLKVLSSHGRLDCLRSIWRALAHQYNEIRGRVEVELRAPQTIPAALLAEITKSLQAALSKQPVVSFVEDPDLLGGLVIRVGDTVYDGSVATQLRRAKQSMIQKSVELIETQRDRLI